MAWHFHNWKAFPHYKMNLALDRGLSLLEALAHHPEGLPLAMLAHELNIPLGACHRLLSDLKHKGYVRQKQKQGEYVLSTKVVSLGLGFLSMGGMVEVAGPLLEQLAQQSGELVRLSLVDGDRLTFVAKAQGPRQQGVRYDPDMGADVWLSCSASGHAWMQTLSDERALALVSGQGWGPPSAYGPKAPVTVKALLGFLHAARVRGYAMIDEVFAPGMAAVAAPIVRKQEAIGVISVAGPRTRLSVERMQLLAAPLLRAAAELGHVTPASTLFVRPALGKG